jgi:hypothetical protein
MLVNMGASTECISRNIPQETVCTCMQQITPTNSVACYDKTCHPESQRGVVFRSLDSRGMRWHGMEESCV